MLSIDWIAILTSAATPTSFLDIYDTQFKHMEWVLTFVVSIIALFIGGVRLRDIVAYQKQQKYNAVNGFYVQLNLQCKILREALDIDDNIWKGDMRTDSIRNLATEFLDFLKSATGQIPFVGSGDSAKRANSDNEYEQWIEKREKLQLILIDFSYLGITNRINDDKKTETLDNLRGYLDYFVGKTKEAIDANSPNQKNSHNNS